MEIQICQSILIGTSLLLNLLAIVMLSAVLSELKISKHRWLELKHQLETKGE